MTKPTSVSVDAKKKLPAGSLIEYCGCSSSFQDNLYGTGQRVKNRAKEGAKVCTVCGKKS